MSLLDRYKDPDGAPIGGGKTSLLGQYEMPGGGGLLSQYTLPGTGEGEIRNAPATWGDVFSSAGKVSLPGQLLRVAKAALGDEEAYADLQRGPIKSLSPQEREGFFGTVVPTYAAAGGLLAGSPTGLGLGPFLAREGIGLGTGAATRGVIAQGRGQDVTDAVLDPTSIAIDAGMSAIPEVLHGGKVASSAVWNALPDSLTEPVARAATAVASKAASAGDRFLTRVAERYPRFGAKLIDDSEGPMQLANAYERPPLSEPDFSAAVTKRQPGADPIGRTPLEGIKENTWQYAARNLAGDSDPFVDWAGRAVERGAKLDRTVEQLAQPRLAALENVAPTESEAVFNLLDQGIDVNAPKELADKARPLRALLRDVGDLRENRPVWDQVPRRRAMEVLTQNEDTPWDTTAVHSLGKRDTYLPAQHRDFFVPYREGMSPYTGRSMTSIERIMAANPEMAAQDAMKRLRGMVTGKTTGYARTGEMEHSTNLHEVLPGYIDSELKRVTNAEVFGGKPIKLTLETTKGPVELTVGDKAATAYQHMLNTGQHSKARLFANALVERYAPASGYEGEIARGAARMTSDMAMGHTALTQTGQMHTPIWASGGPRQIARGYAMVENNPDLKHLFAIGPQKTSFVDYLALGRGENLPKGGSLPGPFEAMTGVENFLRGPNSYAAVAMIDDIAQEAKAVRDAGGSYSAALVKRAAEAGTTPDALADEIGTNGILSRGTWLNSIQHLVDRWQYQTGPGEVGHWLRTPTGALLAQYRSYGMKATQHVMDDVIAPLFSKDPSLRSLGMQRARDLGLYGVPLNIGTGAIKALARGRAPSAHALLNGITGPTGIAGDVAMAGIDAASPEYGDHPLLNLAEIPSASVPLQATENVLGFARDPLRAVSGAATLAGAIDPRIPMYSAPFLGAARSLTR